MSLVRYSALLVIEFATATRGVPDARRAVHVLSPALSGVRLNRSWYTAVTYAEISLEETVATEMLAGTGAAWAAGAVTPATTATARAAPAVRVVHVRRARRSDPADSCKYMSAP